MRLDDEDIATAIACHALGFAQIGLGHLPGQKILARRGEFLNAACHIDDIEIVLQIDRERARLIKLTKTSSARANDFDATEKFALEWVAVFAGTGGERQEGNDGGASCAGAEASEHGGSLAVAFCSEFRL